MDKRITHRIVGLDPDSPFAGSGRGVYGKADLRRLLDIAKQAGLRVAVNEVSEED
jgi:hypothetical protein